MKIEKQRQTERKIESRKKMVDGIVYTVHFMYAHSRLHNCCVANIYAINFRLSGGKL